ncbi:15482_t:CDS:1, partial [Racocetra persica]
MPTLSISSYEEDYESIHGEEYKLIYEEEYKPMYEKKYKLMHEEEYEPMYKKVYKPKLQLDNSEVSESSQVQKSNRSNSTYT